MADEVLVEDWTPGRRLWLKTPGRYSMDVAFEILRWIERFDGVSILDSGWSSHNYGNLVEKGVVVEFGTIRFSVMCSYDDLFIDRIAGDNRRFTTLGESIQQTFAAI